VVVVVVSGVCEREREGGPPARAADKKGGEGRQA